jgi:uncharacterized protein YkwD
MPPAAQPPGPRAAPGPGAPRRHTPATGPRLRQALRAAAWVLGLAAAAPAPGAGDPRAAATATLVAINEARAQAGVAALQASPHLAALAQAHSAHMAREQRLSHDGFEQRRRQAGAGRCVENVAQGLATPGPLVAAWLAQAGHRRNLLAPGLQTAAVAAEGGFVTFLACD